MILIIGMIDLLIIFSSSCLGIISSLFTLYFFITRKENRFKTLWNPKYELNNLLFEKSMALEALNKINRYYEEKKIDDYEKDRLMLKYNKYLEHYNTRIFQIQPKVEAQEVYQYRNQLKSLVTDYISKIDSKLAFIPTDKSGMEKDKSSNWVAFNSSTKEPSISSTNNIINQNTGKSVDTKLIKDHSHTDLQNKDTSLMNSIDEVSNSSVIGRNNLNENVKNNNINLEDIDKIQKDILNTLKRLEES